VGEERDGMRARKFGHAYGFGLGADNEEIIFLYLVISVSFKVFFITGAGFRTTRFVRRRAYQYAILLHVRSISICKRITYLDALRIAYKYAPRIAYGYAPEVHIFIIDLSNLK